MWIEVIKIRGMKKLFINTNHIVEFEPGDEGTWDIVLTLNLRINIKDKIKYILNGLEFECSVNEFVKKVLS